MKTNFPYCLQLYIKIISYSCKQYYLHRDNSAGTRPHTHASTQHVRLVLNADTCILCTANVVGGNGLDGETNYKEKSLVKKRWLFTPSVSWPEAQITQTQAKGATLHTDLFIVRQPFCLPLHMHKTEFIIILCGRVLNSIDLSCTLAVLIHW